MRPGQLESLSDLSLKHRVSTKWITSSKLGLHAWAQAHLNPLVHPSSLFPTLGLRSQAKPGPILRSGLPNSTHDWWKFQTTKISWKFNLMKKRNMQIQFQYTNRDYTTNTPLSILQQKKNSSPHACPIISIFFYKSFMSIKMSFKINPRARLCREGGAILLL